MSVRPRPGLPALVILTVLALLPQPAIAAPAPPAARPPSDAAPAVPAEDAPMAVAPAARDAVLGSGWRKSTDIAWTTSGDANGFHILAAAADTGYTWRAVASLSEPGFETDQWIGNACLSGSGRRLAVVYAPRTFTNEERLFDRGGFAAVVDLVSGTVVKLPVMSSLAYFSPGCGAGSTAVLSQFGGVAGQTRLLSVDLDTAKVAAPVTVGIELTSAVPVPGGIVAAASEQLVRVDKAGKASGLTRTAGVAYGLVPDAAGRVVFLEHAGDQARVRLADGARRSVASTLAQGARTGLGLARAAGGRVFITGETATLPAALPAAITRVPAPAGAALSSRGELVLTRVGFAGDNRQLASDPSVPRAVAVTAKVRKTGREVRFGVHASAARPGSTPPGRSAHPKLSVSRPAGLRVAPSLASPASPVEDETERYCAVPRNDPRNQALQPRPRQVEWAVDQAVTGTGYASRPANWMNLGMPAYSPLGLFPRVPLAGGGRVPAQIYLGIVAQESNMWQAARFAVPGVTANPLIGNFYGLEIYNSTPADDWDINWAKADCGYGVGQVTDGMRLAGKEKPGEVALPYQTQRAVALDFAVNVAAGLQILQRKWNETRNAGLVVNDGDAANIENWFYAVWAYNSGFYPESTASQHNGAWGVGWANNPINPKYPAGRPAFLASSYDDARNPQWWPYPEKVIGFAAYPPSLPDGVDTLVSAYRAAWWGGASPLMNRLLAKPPIELFCDSTNNCQPGGQFPPQDPDVVGEPAGPCYHKNIFNQDDLKCWYHRPAQWKTCVDDCGYELLRFDPGWAYQPDAASYPPRCDRGGLPGGALVVDDVPDGTPAVRTGCTPPTSNGTFALDFGGSGGTYPSKIDFHQIGGGFGGHFWFAHTRPAGADGGKMKVSGTWALDRPLTQWARFMVHLPDHGAHTRLAAYEIDLGGGFTGRKRIVQQRVQQNRWVSLGAFPVSGVPRIRLTSDAGDGTGEEDIAWDAVAFEPLAQRPRHQIVALGDSYASGEGASSMGGENYYRETDVKQKIFVAGDNEKILYQNLCHRSEYAWSRQAVLTDDGRSIGERADTWDPQMDFHLRACSGAESENILPYYSVPADELKPRNGDGQMGDYRLWGEPTQLDQGYVDEFTTLVTLSIGGNDARFVPILTKCILGSDCKNQVLDGDTEVLRIAEPAYLAGPFKASVVSVLREIHKKAPNARIMLMGYPRLLEDTLECDLMFGDLDVDWLTETADLVAARMQDAVVEIKGEFPGLQVTFANPISDFSGSGVCGAHESIHRIVTVLTPGEEGPLPGFFPEGWNALGKSQQSFHPTVSGANIYAHRMRDTLYDLWGM
jgi:hypothetical protein